MNTDIGEMINMDRERQGISQKDLTRGLLSEKEYEAFKTGEGISEYFIIKCLAERLGIRNRRYTVYMGKEEFEKQNLFEQVYNDILMKRSESAEKGLRSLESKLQGSVFEKIMYVRLMLFYENRMGKRDYVPDSDVIDFIEKVNEELAENALLSPDELSLLAEYTVHTAENTESQKEVLFDILVYLKKQTEILYQKEDIYAIANFYYGKLLFEEKDYLGCIKVCEEGLKVTKATNSVSFTAELYESMALSNKEMDKFDLYEKQMRASQIVTEMFYTETFEKKGELYGLLQHRRNFEE